MSLPALEHAPSGRAHHLVPAGLVVAAVALLVLLPLVLGDAGRLAVVLALQLGLVLAWVLTTGIEGFAGSLALGAAAAVAADLALVLPVRGTVGGLLAVLGLGFIAAVLQQMSRRPRHDLVAFLSGGILLLCAIAALATLLLGGRAPGGPDPAVGLLVAVGAALVAGHLTDLALPRPKLASGGPRGLPGLALSVVAGAAAAFAAGALGGAPEGAAAPASGAVLGLVAGLTAIAASFVVVGATAAGDRGRHGVAGSPWAPGVLLAILPLAACAPVALALESLL